MSLDLSVLRWKTYLLRLQKSIVIFLMIFLPILVFVQVLLRYVFHAPLMGIEELMLFPTIWLYMLGGAYASKDRTHITCGILTLYIKREITMKIFNIVKVLLSLIVSIWLTYWAFGYFMYSLKTWKVSELLYIPMFFGESAMFIGLVLMTFYTLLELYDNLRKLTSDYRRKGEMMEWKC